MRVGSAPSPEQTTFGLSGVRRLAWLYRLTTGAFAVAGALTCWVAATAMHRNMNAPLGIGCAALALVTHWWGWWPR